jgi:hypothetical protein
MVDKHFCFHRPSCVTGDWTVGKRARATVGMSRVDMARVRTLRMCRQLKLLPGSCPAGALPRGRWSPGLAESAVANDATNARTPHVSERPTVPASASPRVSCTDTRRGPSHARPLGTSSPGRHVPPLFGGALPFVFARAVVGTRPVLTFNASARALPFFPLFFYSRKIMWF